MTPHGKVPRISTSLTPADRMGNWKARWGIGRMDYLVPAGLYAVGDPTSAAPVLVTSNYKMSYDIVRSTMQGRNVWLLVLETYGINVWCAAGKGTFGTSELVRLIKATRLAQVLEHRTLLLPILGAPGVAAHKVAKDTGFTVRYATIRASDLPAYLDNGLKATPEMRELTFTLWERMVLVPYELVSALKPVAVVSIVTLLLTTLLGNFQAGILALTAFVGAVMAGVVIGPTLLPWLPGRGFSFKGATAGAGWSLAFYFLARADWSLPTTIAIFLALPAVSAFFTLNFTGCSPFTSRSGVKKEMRIALPLMGGAIIVSLLLLAIAFIRQ